MCFRKVNGIFTGTDAPFAPGSNNCQLRSQCFYRKFKANLVITFARSTMSNSISTFFFSDLY